MDNYDLQVDMGKEIFLAFDQEIMIRKFSLDADAQYLYLTYLHTPCRIDRKTGSIEECIANSWQECRDFSTVMTIYDLLCYSEGPHMPQLTHQWCTVGTFVVTGVTNTETFTRRYAAKFLNRAEELRSACEKMGGLFQPRMAGADSTCQIPVTPFFPVLLQFWDGDDEFPPKLLLLWDRNADRFLHFETTFYLQGDLLSRLAKHM